MASKKEFTATEVMVLQEEIRGQLRVVTEIVTSHSQKFDTLTEMVAQNTEDITVIKNVQREHSRVLGEHSQVLSGHSADFRAIRNDIAEIKRELKQKVDRAELTRIG
ncbi:MAG: hypothetical protein AAB647_03915 [Patescibacteria group bacterium]